MRPGDPFKGRHRKHSRRRAVITTSISALALLGAALGATAAAGNASPPPFAGIPAQTVLGPVEHVTQAAQVKPCKTEDSTGCYWNAATQGNGRGRSFYAPPAWVDMRPVPAGACRDLHIRHCARDAVLVVTTGGSWVITRDNHGYPS